MAELRQKMAEKRAKKAEEDAKEHKISETIRRKAGQVRRTIILQSFIPTFEKDLGQIKEELEKKEAELQQLRLLEIQRKEVYSDHLLCFLRSLNRPSSRTKPHYSLNWKNFPLCGNHLIDS